MKDVYQTRSAFLVKIEAGRGKTAKELPWTGRGLPYGSVTV